MNVWYKTEVELSDLTHPEDQFGCLLFSVGCDQELYETSFFLTYYSRLDTC